MNKEIECSNISATYKHTKTHLTERENRKESFLWTLLFSFCWIDFSSL